MQTYEIRFLDRLNFCVLAREWIGADDLDALEEAKRLCVTHAIEVWEGARRVVRVNKAARPLLVADRQSL